MQGENTSGLWAYHTIPFYCTCTYLDLIRIILLASHFFSRFTAFHIRLPYLCKPCKDSAGQDKGYGEYNVHKWIIDLHMTVVFTIQHSLHNLQPELLPKNGFLLLVVVKICKHIKWCLECDNV